MSDSFTEVAEKGYFQRIADAFVGVLVGLVLFLGSFVLLFWNESRSVTVAKTLDEGAATVVSVPSDRVDPSNEGKLIHVSAVTATTESLSDPDFGVRLSGLRLLRHVEMYQWDEKKQEETRKKLGGGEEKTTTYSYIKTWSKDPIATSKFKQPEGHTNPSSFPYAELDLRAENATIGAFRFGRELIGQLTAFDKLPVQESMVAQMTATARARTRVSDSMFYLGSDPSSPQVGDLRISFQSIKPQAASVVARQSAGGFAAYQAKAGDSILLVELGAKDAQAMFKTAKDANSTLTWILRLVGWLLMTIGLGLILRPIAVIADFIPFAGSLATFGAFLFSALVSTALSFVTIAVAWVVVRPLVGIAMFVAAGLGVALTVIVGLKAKRGKQPALLRS